MTFPGVKHSSLLCPKKVLWYRHQDCVAVIALEAVCQSGQSLAANGGVTDAAQVIGLKQTTETQSKLLNTELYNIFLFY